MIVQIEIPDDFDILTLSVQKRVYGRTLMDRKVLTKEDLTTNGVPAPLFKDFEEMVGHYKKRGHGDD